MNQNLAEAAREWRFFSKADRHGQKADQVAHFRGHFLLTARVGADFLQQQALVSAAGGEHPVGRLLFR